VKNIVLILIVACLFVACEDPYDNVSESKIYHGNPFVSLSSEQAAIDLGVNESNNHTQQAGVFVDSLILSHVLYNDLTVYLEIVDEESNGQLENHFSFQQTVTIQAGSNYGTYTVSGLNLQVDELSNYKLAVRIKSVDNEQVIAGLYGTKKENEERQKRFKTYSFQN